MSVLRGIRLPMLPWRWHQRRIAAGRGASWLVAGFAGFAGTILLTVLISMAFGSRALIVRSGSMSPAIDTGDVVVSSPVSPGEARAGDIVTFKDPSDPSRLLTHRVRTTIPGTDRVAFVTRGDANNASERWSIENDGTLGRVALRIPALGRLLVATETPTGRIVLIALPALILAGVGLFQIWAPSPRREGR